MINNNFICGGHMQKKLLKQMINWLKIAIRWTIIKNNDGMAYFDVNTLCKSCKYDTQWAQTHRHITKRSHYPTMKIKLKQLMPVFQHIHTHSHPVFPCANKRGASRRNLRRYIDMSILPSLSLLNKYVDNVLEKSLKLFFQES